MSSQSKQCPHCSVSAAAPDPPLFGAGNRQFSTLIIAGGAAVAASLGGLLLDDGVKLGEEAVENGGIPGVNLSTAPIDDNTRLLLQIAVGLLGVVGVSIGAQLQLSGWRVGW